MIKTKSPSKNASTGLLRIRPQSRAKPVRTRSSAPSISASVLDAMIRDLKSQIERLTSFIAAQPLKREEELVFLSELHSLNVLRDRMEVMRSGESPAARKIAAEHLGKKMQSAFSD